MINDINGELINLYRVVQHHLEEFVRQFKWVLTSRQVFEWLKVTRQLTFGGKSKGKALAMPRNHRKS